MEFDEPATTVHQDQMILSTSSDVELDLLKDFQTMYLDSPHADFKLLVQDDAIRVHKCVLSARSPVFAKLLASSMAEMSNDEIKIDDIEIPILKTFINFLYTGRLPEAELEFDNVCGLYYAADKYDVPSLRKWCSNYLAFKMDAENACRLLSLANRHSDEKLKDLVMDYIKFEFEAVLGSESLAEFVKNETELAIEVLKLRGKKIEKKSSS
ncbi:hypothetical protein JTE90_024469 [Oedothorax gibbosus]|uniref:BTB domain-containing protein n=1 Tax=Oedothorax gibbosus TaxID=931172 RepID=A0AAV6UI04_9ARAC|nr:hypothetical protein JTE90_024469 [Oedothorax gibbosus]